MPDDPDEIRTIVHAIWGNVAPQWEAHADEVDERGAIQTRALLERAQIGPGDRVLELACGPGGTGLAAAEAMGPEGSVVLSDVAASMTAIAAARAADRGLDNVTTAILDLEAIDQPGGSFDAVVCREGLMFAVDPDRAAAEALRVLAPNGRAALSVWGPKADNPWLAELLDGASEVLGVPMPPPGIPGPFSLANADLAGLLEGAGFVDVAVEDVPVPQRLPSFDDYWALTPDLAGPLAGVLAGLPDEQRQAIADRVRHGLVPYTSDAGLDVPGSCRVVSGRKE
ncbi:MAG TPA: methyltransferase domain-containing protein [Acidimicrobiales bacterium]|nr:methyltransferase domain-containing protein [Acidimicrobiales bacterium]